MAQQLISVIGNEILFDALSAKVTLDGNGDAILSVELQVYSEPTHPKPYSVSEDKRKRIIDMVSTNNGISSVAGVKVLTAETSGTTKFKLEIPIASKVPNSGSDFLELEKLFKEQLEEFRKLIK